MRSVLLMCIGGLVACGPINNASEPGDAGVKVDTDAGSVDGGESLPLTRDEIVAFARSGTYLSWHAEPAAHPSAGPHGGSVRTFVNDALYASLKQGNATHPVRSIAVKELFTGSTRSGWAVDVKGPDGVWVYFEGFEPALNQYYFRGNGNLCANCHRGGVDTVLVPATAFP